MWVSKKLQRYEEENKRSQDQQEVPKGRQTVVSVYLRPALYHSLQRAAAAGNTSVSRYVRTLLVRELRTDKFYRPTTSEVLALRAQGLSVRQIARELTTSPSKVHRVLQFSTGEPS